MKKRLLLFATCLSALTAFAQVEKEDNRWSNLDMKEDSTEIVTIDDIIKEQQDVTSRNTREMHYASVWGRRGFFNIAYNKEATLKPWNPAETNNMKADWSFALQRGHNYVLHRKPIANTIQICLDYTGFDLSASHYNASTGQNVRGGIRIPWNLEKYEATYGMSLGPSLTVAPFNYVGYDPIHYMKFNVYFHVGYQVSLLYLFNNEDKEIANNLLWGHGLYKAFGACMSWKAIGVGFEKRAGNTSYMPFNTTTFGSDKKGFHSNFTRFYIQFRM